MSRVVLTSSSALVLFFIGTGCTDFAAPVPVADAASVDAMFADDVAGGVAGMVCVSQGERHFPADPGIHVASLAGITFNSNPPSSGSHCDAWGQRAAYSPVRPLPRCNWLHNLEHGWVVLLYNCPQGCPELVTALEGVMAAATGDPECPRPRVILTPDPELDVRVAAAAWRFTWKSDCLDAAARASLGTFIGAHLGTHGEAPEVGICQDGSVAP